MQKHHFIFLFSFLLIFSVSEAALAAIISLPRYQGSIAHKYTDRTQSGGRDQVCSSSYKYTCSGTGYAGGVGTSCNDLYISCSCSSDYKWSGGVCLSKNCEDYGYLASEDKSKSCELKNPKAKLDCWKCEACDGTIYKHACSGGLNASVQPADYKCGNKYSQCTCVANAIYTNNECICKAGYYKNGDTCSPCPAGSYSGNGATSCLQCPSGQYSATTAAISCSVCKGGTYSVAGSSNCTQCNAGTYSADGASKCDSCSDGKYSLKGASVCTPCSSGISNSTHSGCRECLTDADCPRQDITIDRYCYTNQMCQECGPHSKFDEKSRNCVKRTCFDKKDVGLESCCMGEILFSDMSTGTKLETGKTPIGMVYDCENRLAMALEEKKLAFAEYTCGTCSGLGVDLPYANGVNDFDGKNNTAAIKAGCLAYDGGKGRECPAIDFVLNYTTEGTSPGDWYMPSSGEFEGFKDFSMKSQSEDIKATLTALSLEWTGHDFWTSSYCLAYPQTSTTSIGTPYCTRDVRVDYLWVRPVIKF